MEYHYGNSQNREEAIEEILTQLATFQDGFQLYLNGFVEYNDELSDEYAVQFANYKDELAERIQKVETELNELIDFSDSVGSWIGA